MGRGGRGSFLPQCLTLLDQPPRRDQNSHFPSELNNNLVSHDDSEEGRHGPDFLQSITPPPPHGYIWFFVENESRGVGTGGDHVRWNILVLQIPKFTKYAW